MMNREIFKGTVTLFQEFPAKTGKEQKAENPSGQLIYLPDFSYYPVTAGPSVIADPFSSRHQCLSYAGIIQLYDDRSPCGFFYQRYFHRAAAEQIHRKKFRPEKSRIGRRNPPGPAIAMPERGFQ
ncbi:MAG: hypothetical protein WCE98_06965 [Chlorobium sp.]|jgi:hypothetical protein